MNCALLTVAIRYEHDVVLTRQRARQVAALAGFDRHDQVRIATAVSEIARNAFRYAKGAKAAFSLVPGPPTLLEVRMHDQGPGIPNLKQVLDGQYESSTGLGLGILGAKRLSDHFEIESSPGGGTRITVEVRL